MLDPLVVPFLRNEAGTVRSTTTAVPIETGVGLAKGLAGELFRG